MAEQSATPDEMKCKYRYEVAGEVLRQNGSNADIQQRVMQESPDSRSNPTRAQWYRRSWDKCDHCRGNQQTQLQKRLSSIDKDAVSRAIFEAAQKERDDEVVVVDDLHTAVPIRVSKETFDLCIHVWKAVNNDHLVQLLILSL